LLTWPISEALLSLSPTLSTLELSLPNITTTFFRSDSDSTAGVSLSPYPQRQFPVLNSANAFNALAEPTLSQNLPEAFTLQPLACDP